VLRKNGSEATSGYTDEVTAMQKLASYLRMISSTKRIRASKISALSAAVYKDILHKTKISERVA
jgi:hypothetical protein